MSATAVAIITATSVLGAGSAYVGHEMMQSHPEISGDTCTDMSGVPIEDAFTDASVSSIQQAIMDKAGIEIIGGSDGEFGQASCIAFGMAQQALDITVDYKFGPESAGALGVDISSMDLASIEDAQESLEVTAAESCRVSTDLNFDGVVDTEDVGAFQRQYNNVSERDVRVDDDCGPVSTRAMLNMQGSLGVTVDGNWGRESQSAFIAKYGSSKDHSDSPKSDDISTEIAKNDCTYQVISEKEVSRLLSGGPNRSGLELCNDVIDFQRQHGLAPDAVVGPITAQKMIELASNPCNLYGTTTNDCLVGVQKNGNLGQIYVVEDGEIINSFSGRFGNADRGRRTPEGQFIVQRYKKGEHISSNCVDSSGNGFVCMWNSLYFDGGVAFHGTKGPNNPNGSLGCMGSSIEDSAFVYAQYEDGKIQKIVVVDFQRPQYQQYS